jgi:hypothetical protein
MEEIHEMKNRAFDQSTELSVLRLTPLLSLQNETKLTMNFLSLSTCIPLLESYKVETLTERKGV